MRSRLWRWRLRAIRMILLESVCGLSCRQKTAIRKQLGRAPPRVKWGERPCCHVVCRAMMVCWRVRVSRTRIRKICRHTYVVVTLSCERVCARARKRFLISHWCPGELRFGFVFRQVVSGVAWSMSFQRGHRPIMLHRRRVATRSALTSFGVEALGLKAQGHG